jgi:tetratricopeptide (TPR) repeat protein/type II secretory pathway pseudopilin PulG
MRTRGSRPAKEPRRRKGIVADEAQLRARIELARAIGDPAEERAASKKLAAILAERGSELDFAVELAFRAIGDLHARGGDGVSGASEDEPTLRHLLAGWLERLGEPGLAASELRKLASAAVGKEAAAILVRIGVLHARAGDAVGAQEAFLEAAEKDDADALPLELLGAVAAWAAATHGPAVANLEEGFPGPRAGAEAYVRAARRRAAARDKDGEIEDLLRAFELDPTSPLAVAALMGAYTVRERHEAADHVLRQHAVALAARGMTPPNEAGPADVHARRRAAALEAGHIGRAFGAALDEGLDRVFEGPSADIFDDMLARVSAYEPLAVRLEVRSEREKDKAASIRWAELGRLLSGPLAAPERAAEVLARAVAADATNTEAVHALRAIVQKSGDDAWLLEALVRAAMGGNAHGASSEAASRLTAAHQLAALAEERNDVLLSAWAYSVIAELDPADDRARAAVARLEVAVRRHEEELALARKALETSAKDGRAVALEELVRLARSRPDASRELAGALLELAEIRGRAPAGDTPPLEDPVFAEAVRVAERIGDFAGLAHLARARLEARGPNVRVRGLLVRALRRQGDLAGASAAARAFAEESATRWTCSVAWIAAALAGDHATRGRAMAAVAPACGSQVVATISAVAAEVLEEAGENEAARKAAEQACRADGQNVRALLVLARLAMDDGGRVAQAAIERAMAVAGPSSAFCTRLADILAQAGDLRGAVAWARRCVALRPGDPAATQALLERAVRAGDAEALAEALSWLAPQPQPSKEMADRIAPGLESLAALDAPRAASVARRALDVLGPRHAPFRRAVEHVADVAKDAGLRVVLGERWIAAGAPAAERGPLLLELAGHYRALGDVDAELRAYARAAREGVALGSCAARIDELASRDKTPDTELAFLEALAEARLSQGMVSEAADAFRDLGAALWDMADDRPRAVQAWLRGAHCDSVYGYDTLRRDLAAFADAQYAVDCLSELVEREADRVRSGVIATQAARAALDVRAYNRALALAKIALERDPGHADALETAEKACAELGRIQEMSTIYDQVARRARGRFGRRAAHHRAARFFESGGVAILALKHAAQAFIAVPSEGSTLGLLQRTAAKAQRENIAVRTIEHVAELSRSPHARAGWLLRAASMTSRDLEGTRQKMDLLLKASVLVPTPVTLSMLAVAAREIVSLAPEDAAAVALRLERAAEQLAKGLEGPDGARIAITFVEMAMELFADGEWGWRSLERAVGADADVDEYVKLLPHAPALGRAAGAAQALERLVAEVEKPYSNVGHALLRLAGAIAKEVGDGAKRAKLLVRAAEKEPDDDAIVAEADEAVTAHPDAALVERLSKRVGVFRRTEALRALAKKALAEGEASVAVKHLERASEIATFEQRPDVAKELNEALVAAGRGEEAILRELARPDMPKPERAVRWAELARLRREHGDAAGAVDALLQAATEEPTAARWSAVEAAAEEAGREHIRVEALQHLARLARASDSWEEQRAVLKRLARAEGARGALAAAEAAWREVLELDASDPEADVAIEALLVARNSYDDLALHLGERVQRLAQSTSADDRDKLRAVRLRRAAILEQRLGRLEEACTELEQVLLEHPDHPSALRWLADLYERAGEPAKALPALERLFGAATEELEYVTIGVRRVRALAAAGEIAKAKAAIADLVSRAPSVIAVAEARVEVARAAQDPDELGDALEALARISVEEPHVRSEMLVEAAQAAARAADSAKSLVRAREAARLAPDVASTQLFARGLEYRLRGPGTRDEALATIASLERITSDPAARAAEAKAPLEPEDVALHAFLLAEAEDVVHGPGPGEVRLKRCLAQVGAQPLVALGLAERAARAGRHEEAYRFYTEAVYGNLLGLRRPGRVAMAAAESAWRAGDVASTQRFLNEAAKDPETRTEALRRVAKVALSRDDMVKARSVLRGLAEGLFGQDRAEILAELARALLSSNNPSERLEGDRTMREAIDHATPDGAAALRAELEAFRGRTPLQMAMPATRSPTPKPPRGATPAFGTASVGAAPPPLPRERAVATAAADGDGEVPTRIVATEGAEDATQEIATKEISAEPAEQRTQEVETREIETREIETRRLSVEIPGLPKIPPPPPVLLANPEEPPIMSVRHPALGSDRPPPAQVNAPLASAGSAQASEVPTTPAGKVAKARARLVHGSREEAERLLTEALREGSIDAADLLDQLLRDEPSRRAALIKVRRQAVELNPGSVPRLVALRDAAKADQNANYVRAIDHVLRAFDKAAGPLPPPPLSAQNAQPGILTLLTRHSHEPAGEAFGIVWEGATAVFAKTPAAAGMTGLERVVPGPTSALSRLYEVALRLLDTPRFALFQKRASSLGKPRQGELPFEEEGQPLSVTTALLTTPAAIISGDTREDTNDLRWVLGHALSCVLPQNALVLGLGEAEARALWGVILGAFGPPGLVTIDRKDAQLADMLWQTLAPRTQRRLKELLANSDATSFELVRERAKQSGRRIGMFLTGDFAHAARKVLEDFPQANAAELERPGGLERLCAQLPSLADLLRLAVRPEYADARWHLPTPASQRLASGRLPPV